MPSTGPDFAPTCSDMESSGRTSGVMCSMMNDPSDETASFCQCGVLSCINAPWDLLQASPVDVGNAQP